MGTYNTIDLSLQQHLHITPQLQQAILLLQLNAQELTEKIQEIAERNPFVDLENSLHTEDEQKTKLATQDNQKIAEKLFEETVSARGEVATQHNQLDESAYQHFLENYSPSKNIHDHLLAQLELEHFNKAQYWIAENIIDAIDENGYLRLSIDELVNLSQKYGMPQTAEEIETVIQVIQKFDPTGVGARNLQECLRLQLEELALDVQLPHKIFDLVNSYLQDLSRHDYAIIQKKLKINAEELQHMLDIIQSLNPHPGSVFTDFSAMNIVPEVIVQKQNGYWVARLNVDILPKVAINSHYIQYLKDKSGEKVEFLQKNWQEAQWLLKSLQKRNETLLAVAEFIVKNQQDFFEHGPKALKPMVLSDVAKFLEVHESTVSRITTQKFIFSPQGMFELKYFFSSHVRKKDSMEAISSVAIKAMIQELIEQESYEETLSDNAITQKLQTAGIDIARRTVAKYRENLNIPTCEERKRMKKILELE